MYIFTNYILYNIYIHINYIYIIDIIYIHLLWSKWLKITVVLQKHFCPRLARNTVKR